MLPEGWTKVPLSQVAEVRTGIAVGKSDIQDPIELPYLRVANVQDGRLDLSDVKTIRVERSQVERYQLRPGDVLMTEGGDFDKLGRGDVWRGQITTCLHQNHVFSVRPNPKRLHSEFLAALSASEYGKAYFLGCAKRSTNLASINSTQLNGFPVLLPPLPEQRRIATVLDTWDSAIETAERLRASSVRQKKALAHSLLTGNKRFFPGRDAWAELEIGEVSTRIQRESDGKTHPVLMISSSGGFVRQDEKYGRFMAGKSLSYYILLEKGEFAYNKGNSKRYQFGCVFALHNFERALVPHVYVCFRLRSDLHGPYYAHLFESDYLKPQLAGLVNTGVRNNGLLNIKPSEFLKTKVPVPPLDEQIEIAAAMDHADAAIKNLEAELSALRTEKAALMQQLLTGKRRVKLDSAAVPELEPQS